MVGHLRVVTGMSTIFQNPTGLHGVFVQIKIVLFGQMNSKSHSFGRRKPNRMQSLEHVDGNNGPLPLGGELGQGGISTNMQSLNWCPCAVYNLYNTKWHVS